MLFGTRLHSNYISPQKSELDLHFRYALYKRPYKAELCRKISNAYKSAKIIEVNCEFGLISLNIIIKNPKLHIVAMDPCAAMIQKTMLNPEVKRFKERWRGVVGVAENMPIQNSFFDLAFAVDSLHHWRYPVKVIQELARVVKKGGIIYISDLRRNANEEMIRLMVQNWKDNDSLESRWFLKRFVHSWRSSYLPSELEEIAYKAGLRKYTVDDDGPLALLLQATIE